MSQKNLHHDVYHQEHKGTLIFLHGAGYDGSMWLDVIQGLGEYLCITIDLPGHGQSCHIPFTTIEEAADHVIATLKSIGAMGQNCHIIGLSLGGYIGMSLIHRYQEFFGKAILTGFSVLPLSGFFWMKMAGYALSPFCCTKWYRRLSEQSMRIPKYSAMRHAHKPAVTSPVTVRSVLNAVGQFALSEEDTADIKTPLLALAGETEHEFLKKSITHLSNTMPHCQSYEIPQLGHAWPAQDPALAIRLIRSWIDNTQLPS